MSTLGAALKGMVWFAAASWLQLLLGLLNFLVVARHLDPVALGAFGAAILISGIVDTLLGSPLTQSLEQRAEIERRHIDATFWIAMSLSVVMMIGMIFGGGALLGLVNATEGWPLLTVISLGVPFSVAGGVLTSLLSRDLRFAELGRIGVASNMLGSVVSIVTLLLGGGVWSLVAADFVSRIARFAGVAWAAKYRPGPPRDLGSIRDLMSFNVMALLTNGLTYLDLAAPRLLTSYFLGTASLGYLSIAQRCLDLLNQITLMPLSRVMMVSVARLNHDPVALRHLIRTVYWISTSLAYPAFLIAAMLAPDIVRLLGAQWQPAVLAMQILMLVGLRTATGAFNSGILQGAGRIAGPPIILGVGLLLQVVLVPIGAQFGTAGVAMAILLRTIATWPIGCWLVWRASGISMREQLRIGNGAMLASVLMCVVIAGVRWLLPEDPVLLRLVVAALVGVASYLVLFLALTPAARQVGSALLGDLRRGDPKAIKGRLRDALRA